MKYYKIRRITDEEIMPKNIDLMKHLYVKEWYRKEFPSDEVGKHIKNDLSFYDIYRHYFTRFDSYPFGSEAENIYELLDDDSSGYHTDSVIRERVFDKLSELMGVPYEVVYDRWLERDE